MKKFRVEVGEWVAIDWDRDDCGFGRKITRGNFQIEAKNAKDAANEALILAKDYEIDRPVIMGITCEEIIYVL